MFNWVNKIKEYFKKVYYCEVCFKPLRPWETNAYLFIGDKDVRPHYFCSKCAKKEVRKASELGFMYVKITKENKNGDTKG